MEKYTYEQLLEIIAKLRSPEGCPWDRAQTHESMIKCLRDECDEVVEAIKNKDDENLCEELRRKAVLPWQMWWMDFPGRWFEDILMCLEMNLWHRALRRVLPAGRQSRRRKRQRRKSAEKIEKKIFKISLNSLTNIGKKAITEVSM